MEYNIFLQAGCSIISRTKNRKGARRTIGGFMKGRLRKYLLAGTAIVLPLTVTFYALWIVFRLFDSWARNLVFAFTEKHFPGVGIVLTLILLLSVGLFATNFVGRRIIDFWESILHRIPLAGVIYKTTKKVVEVIGGKDSRPFQQAVLVEYPRKGIYTVAFVTGEVTLMEKSGSRELVCVYICTTPNPTTGFLILVPRNDVVFLSNTVEEGIQLILSGGIVGTTENGCQRMVLKGE